VTRQPPQLASNRSRSPSRNQRHASPDFAMIMERQSRRGADSAEETRSGYTSARFALDVPMAAVYGTERSNMEILEVLPEFLVVI
jgi:hypothetical protein